jgi:hypothetical protein
MIPHLSRLLHPCFLVAALLAAPASLWGTQGYQSHLPPRTLTLQDLTPAFDPADPARELGKFRPGLSVNVMEARPADGRWLVEYPRSGQSNLQALIPIPSLASPNSASFRKIAETLDGFPILRNVLSSEAPWPKGWSRDPRGGLSADVAVVRGSGGEAVRFMCTANPKQRVWGLEPLRSYYDLSNPERPKFVVEFWNKGEAFRVINFRDEPARNELRRNLQQITNFFDSSGSSVLRERGSNPYLRGIRDNIESFLLPNDTRVSIHYHRGEYLFVEIDQASVAARHGTITRTPAELAEYLRTTVTQNPTGDYFIAGIPMIDQGQTAYCVPATMTRVLNFYGYDVNTHSLAMLAGTTEHNISSSGGTSRDDMLRALRRITDGSPFRFRELRNGSLSSIQNVVAEGVPIIWLVPGHMRLLIGVNSNTQHIVYTDSWGKGHDFKTMPFRDFALINQGMWVLEPR